MWCNTGCQKLILCLIVVFLIINNVSSEILNILMPDARATQVDEYLCTAIELNHESPIFITGFNPSATAKDAHHMLLYGCTEPGSQKKIWNCGEMANGRSEYASGQVCASGSTIIYAWAMDAPSLKLPNDVAFKVGGNTTIKYLVVQVHYANIDKFLAGKSDQSGVVLETSKNSSTKRAGIYLLLTGGQINARTEELFEVACKINQNIVMHPFAFRTHTHKLGLVNSGYRVRGDYKDQVWTEIGRRSPQLPQMFYPINNSITLEKGDYVAAACTMRNIRSKTVRVGPTGDDEMCNFYIMYWVDGEELIDQGICNSAGPPRYYFRRNKNLNVDNIPSDAFRVPPPPNGPESEQILNEHMQHNLRHISSLEDKHYFKQVK